MHKKALFAISNLGLGHATRTLPIIKMYLNKGFSLDIISDGKALLFLQKELEGKQVQFLPLKDYPSLERGSGLAFYFYLISDILTTYARIRTERLYLRSLLKKSNYDFIFSDGKYGFHSKDIPCYLLTHQLSFDIPRVFSFSQKLMDYFNKKYFKKFTCIFIPDYKDPVINLAGKLSHPAWINDINHKYIGVLSSYYDSSNISGVKSSCLFTVSGYLKDHRKTFISKLQEVAKSMQGKKVFMLGDSTKNYVKTDKENDIIIYSYLSGNQKIAHFKGTDLIISRAGYTTIMDLIELDKKAVLFPTPNQTEQTYLANYLGKKGYFLAGNEDSDIKSLLTNTDKIILPHFPTKTKEALETIYLTIGV